MTKQALNDSWVRSLPSSHYVDNRIYVSEDILGEEMDTIFGKVWAFCAHESELPEVGDYMTTSLAGTPLVLVRGPDRAVRALLNVCTHRGTIIVRQPAGNASRFTCLFHRWSFDTMGKCTSVPQPEGFQEAGLRLDQFGLKEYRTAQKLGLIFVSLDDHGPSLEDYLDGVFDTVEDVLSPEPLEVFHYHRIVLSTNWKLWTATNVELYHVWLHFLNRATSVQAPAWLERKPRCFRNGHIAFDPTKHAYDKRKMGSRDLTLPGLAPNEARLAHIFPDLLINIRSSNMRLDRVTPLGAGKVMIECRGLGVKGEPDQDRKRRIDDHNQFWGPFGRNLPEDALAAVLQMQALRSGARRYGLCARENGSTPAMSDEPLRHFYREWSRRVRRPAGDPFGDASAEQRRVPPLSKDVAEQVGCDLQERA